MIKHSEVNFFERREREAKDETVTRKEKGTQTNRICTVTSIVSFFLSHRFTLGISNACFTTFYQMYIRIYYTIYFIV